jgi:hypothetical protein
LPTLTTRGGRKITFKTSDIDAIADHNDSTGEAGTCVYGIIKTLIEIDETVQEFMRRLRIEDKFAQFTRPNGWLVWVNGPSVSSIRAPLRGEFARGTKTVISAGSFLQGVKETPDKVIAAINDHHGEL